MSAPPPAAAVTRLAPFETVIELHGPAVLRFCIARGGADAGEDAFQETMIAALRAYPELRDPAAVRGWLFSIAHRKTIDLARVAARAPRPAGDPQELESVAGGPQDAGGADLVSGDAGSSQALTEDPWMHVRSLPPKQRQAVTLRFLADLTATEVASVMETSPEAARRNVFEGLRRLRTLVEKGEA